MIALLRLAEVLGGISRNVGKAVSWIILVLIFMIMFDVVTRKIDFIKEWSADLTIHYGYSVSFILQDLEWHAHGILLLLTFGFGYMMNAHVRVDIFREMASRRRQVWIEALGLMICAVPFLLVMIYFSWIMTFTSYLQGEGSESQVGIGWRFLIKSFLITGFCVALMAVLATLFRCLCYLFGNEGVRKAAEDSMQFFTDDDALPKLILQQNANNGPTSENGPQGEVPVMLEFWEWLVDDHLYEYIGAYMFLALALTLFTGLPVAIALGGVSLIFGLIAISLDIFDIQVFFAVVNRIWGGDGASGAVQNPILVAIPCFVFMGTMLEKSQVAAHLLHILQIMLRRVPGGLALSVTVMGTIMAATTGIIGASVVMMTLLALPTMLKRGYSPALATGTIAASATLGILIPPSIMLVLMANLLAVSVGNLFIGAVFPGLVLSGLYFLYIMTRASINPSIAPPIGDDEINLTPTNKSNLYLFLGITAGLVAWNSLVGNTGWMPGVNWGLLTFLGIFFAAMYIGKREGDTLLGGILKGFVPPIFLIIMVLGSIFTGWATPTEAAGVGAFGSIILAWVNGTLTKTVLRDVCHRTGLTTAMIFFIFVGATAFSTIFRNVYGEELIIALVEWLNLGPWPLLFILMFAVFLLGFFFDFLEITLIILPVFAPVIRTLAPIFAPHLGLEVPSNIAETLFVESQVIYWFAILVAVNLQTSFLTPPFGFALFYMKGVAPPEVKMQDIYKGIIPFVMLQLVGLGIVIAFPEIALWLPNKMLE